MKSIPKLLAWVWNEEGNTAGVCLRTLRAAIDEHFDPQRAALVWCSCCATALSCPRHRVPRKQGMLHWDADSCESSSAKSQSSDRVSVTVASQCDASDCV